MGVQRGQQGRSETTNDREIRTLTGKMFEGFGSYRTEILRVRGLHLFLDERRQLLGAGFLSVGESRLWLLILTAFHQLSKHFLHSSLNEKSAS